MAATLQQHCTNPPRSSNSSTATPNPQLKRLVYSKYRELLGSYNDQANAYIDTLPAYMVHRDNGFNLELNKEPKIIVTGGSGVGEGLGNAGIETYGSGQRMPSQQTYEAPACVQNAMMTKDKKPFTYTPGGIDLSQIKSERMAKRLARNAQAEGATGQQQHNRPTQPQSPGGSSPGAAASMGAAAMGMPFQVLPPPPPPPGPGKNLNGGSAPAPPPPPPSSSNFSNTGTLAPPSNGNAAGGRGSAPNSPSMARKSPTPQRFEPPPMGFRPEIKIPPNPMAALRKVPPPVEKNTFWKDEYAKERSKSPMVERPATNNANNNDSGVTSSVSSPQTNASSGTGPTSNYGETNINSYNSDNTDGFKKTMPTTNTTNNNAPQQNQTNNNYTNYQNQQQQQTYTPPTPPQQQQQQQQQSPLKPMQQSPQYGGSAPPPPPQPQQQQQSPRPEFRSVAAPQSPAVNVYTRQTDSPRTGDNATPPRATESPFKFAQQQQLQQQQLQQEQLQQQQRAPPAVSPLAQQASPSSASSGASVSSNAQGQSVPWRTQRSQNQPQQSTPQSHPQPIYNNVQQQQQQQQQRSPDFTTQTSAYQGPKPTNVGSLYIAPLAPPTEPQAQHIVRQQLQQQQQQRDSPMRQMAPQQQQQNQGAPSQQLRWMSSQPMSKEQQPAWVRPEENGNVIPSSLNRIKSPPPAAMQQQQQQQQPMQQHMPQQQPQSMFQPLNPGNGFMQQTSAQNFGAQPITSTGLRLQINPQSNQTVQNGPRERIIPIQLEATPTPTYTPVQPSFNNQQQQYGGSTSPAPGYVVRTPNQFVDQGYHNFGHQQQQLQQQQQQRVMSPSSQQLNAPRMVQQTQNNVVAGNKTHIIPISMETNDGTRGPVSKTPIVIQNDLRSPPIQSKSFRILQKITDTIDDGSNDDNANQHQQQRQKQDNYMDAEPQLQRPTFARQMSAQQARNSPTVEQMRRMQIAHEQGNQTPTTPSKFNQQRSLYANNDNSQQYIPPSEQQVPEPKKYTGSAIPSRSFKILQAMTQPENAEEQENSHKDTNEMNDFESKPETTNRKSSNRSSTVEPVSSSNTSLNSDSVFSSSPSPTPPPTQPSAYGPYGYPPYGYPWYPPLPHMMPNQTGDNTNPANWHYPYGMPPPPPPPTSSATGENMPAAQYPPYPYYYPYYPVPPFNPHQQSPGPSAEQIAEFNSQNPYAMYMPPPPPYVAYPYPVAPSYSQSSNSSRASSVLPDIIITPSTDDIPSKVILKHHIKKEKEQRPQKSGSIEIEDVSPLKSNYKPEKETVVDLLTQQLESMSQSMENNLNLKRQMKKTYIKNFDQKSPEDNTSPVRVTMVMTESEQDSEDSESSDSEITPKQCDKQNTAKPVPLQSIRSVNNLQIYHKHKLREDREEESEDDDDDETTADGESDIFDEDDEDDHHDIEDLELEHRIEHEDSECEEFVIEDNLSVIYEEESESDLAKTVIRGDRSSQSGEVSLGKNDDLNTKIEENDDDDECEGGEDRADSNSVTVRLPLKFSFTNDNIGTIEVGSSQIEEKKNSFSLPEKRNSFSVACVESDPEDGDYDDCDVSVTISLTPSGSRSGSIDGRNEHKNMADIYPIDDMPVPEETLDKIESSQEDVSVSFSLNMRNKFANEVLYEKPVETKPKEKHTKSSEAPEEMDFFATLMATKMQAQKVKEQSANYWGKSMEKKDAKEEEKPEKSTDTQENHKPASDSGSAKSATDVQAKTSKISEDTAESRASFWESYNAKNKSEILSEPAKESNETQENKTSFWDSYSAKTNSENKSQASKESNDIEDIWASREEEAEIKKPKFSFWDNSPRTATEKETKTTVTKEAQKVEDIWAKKEEDAVKKPKFSFSDKEPEAKTPAIVAKETEEVEDIWAKKEEEAVKKPKFSFWDNCSKPTTEIKSQTNEKEEIVDIWSTRQKEEVKKTKSETTSSKTKETEEVVDIWADRVEDLPPIKPIKSKRKSLERKSKKTSSVNKETEEVVDIWADRQEDLPPSKPIKSKLKSLESAKNSFWSSVAEAQKDTQVTQKETKPPPKSETITKIKFSMNTLRALVKDLPQSQIAAVHYEEPLQETLSNTQQEEEETEEVDFWAHIERVRESKTPEPRQFNAESNAMSSFGQQETSFWNDDERFNDQPQFDPYKYPEEPREVDTDEEIDFWAEIEAKRQPDDDDVTFHKSASFWASKDRKNSIDETPFKPVLPKAFNSRLPDEPATENINIWAALEAHKGEEPVIIDPEVEEEKALAQEYDEMPEHESDDEETEEEIEEEESHVEPASVHEPVIAAVWSPPAQQEIPETNFWTETYDNQKTEVEEGEQDIKPERDELEVKRSNYRKAMAFFTTSVDDNKDQCVDKYERSKKSMQRNSYVEEEEAEKWDWNAVNEAIAEENKETPTETTPEITREDKELTPKATESSEIVAEEPAPLPEVYIEPSLPLKRLPNGLPDLEVNKFNEERKISVKDRISAFETTSLDLPSPDSRRNSIKNQSLSVESNTRQGSLSRNSSTQRSESEMDEDDSGVTDMNKQLSETDTESDSFPELRKMSSYQRAATHSRLFKLLLDDTETLEESKEETQNADEFQLRPSRRKIVHNVSITRKQNPKALADAESMTQRRERLSLPLRKNTSIDADNPSTPNSPGSPIMGNSANHTVVSDKLVSELVQSLLLKSDSTHFKKLPMEKLQAAAKRVLEEELDSLDNTSIDSTPAMTPNDMIKDKSYADYYNTWSDASGTEEVVPSKSFRALQDTRRTPWTARCPRVLSSKTINRDLSRVTESPEISMRTSKSPECFRQSRENSVGKWKKV